MTRSLAVCRDQCNSQSQNIQAPQASDGFGLQPVLAVDPTVQWYFTTPDFTAAFCKEGLAQTPRSIPCSWLLPPLCFSDANSPQQWHIWSGTAWQLGEREHSMMSPKMIDRSCLMGVGITLPARVFILVPSSFSTTPNPTWSIRAPSGTKPAFLAAPNTSWKWPACPKSVT